MKTKTGSSEYAQEDILPVEQRRSGQRAAMYANLFTGAISQIVLGALMMLYASDVLGFSTVKVGFIISVAPLGMLARFFTLRNIRQAGKIQAIRRSQVSRMIILALLIAIPAKWMGFPLFMALICAFMLSNELGAGVAWQPILRDITTTADRGSFFARMRFAFMVVTTLITSAVPLLIGSTMKEWQYKCLLAFAMAGSANFFFWAGKIPEAGNRKPARDPATETPLWPHLKKVLRRSPLLREPLAITALSTLMAFPVFVLYLKEMLGIPSNMISLFVFAVNAGAALSLLIWGRIADKVGFRPMFAGMLTLTLAVQPILLFLTPWAADWAGPWGSREKATLACLLLHGFLNGSLGAGAGIALTNIQHYCVHPEDVMESMTFLSAAVLLLMSLIALVTSYFLEHVAVPLGVHPLASGWMAWDAVKLWIMAGNVALGLGILRLLRRIPNSHADMEVSDFFDSLIGSLGQAVKVLPVPAVWLFRRSTSTDPDSGDPQP